MSLEFILPKWQSKLFFMANDGSCNHGRLGMLEGEILSIATFNIIIILLFDHFYIIAPIR